MKPLTLLCIFLVSYGAFIFAFQGFLHARASATGHLKPFDEDGERVFVPGLGTVCLGGGVFLLVLTSGRKK